MAREDAVGRGLLNQEIQWQRGYLHDVIGPADLQSPARRFSDDRSRNQNRIRSRRLTLNTWMWKMCNSFVTCNKLICILQKNLVNCPAIKWDVHNFKLFFIWQKHPLCTLRRKVNGGLIGEILELLFAEIPSKQGIFGRSAGTTDYYTVPLSTTMAPILRLSPINCRLSQSPRNLSFLRLSEGPKFYPNLHLEKPFQNNANDDDRAKVRWKNIPRSTPRIRSSKLGTWLSCTESCVISGSVSASTCIFWRRFTIFFLVCFLKTEQTNYNKNMYPMSWTERTREELRGERKRFLH